MNDYTKCVKLHDGVISWCGKNVQYEFAFVDVSHAAYNGLSQGRLVCCKDCSDRIIAALKNGQED